MRPFSINDNWRVVSRRATPLVSLDGVPSGAGQTSGIGTVFESFLLPDRSLAVGRFRVLVRCSSCPPVPAIFAGPVRQVAVGCITSDPQAGSVLSNVRKSVVVCRSGRPAWRVCSGGAANLRQRR